jgi:dynamin 1-like protein
LKEESEATVRTLVDMEGSYLSANFFREIVAAESFSYDPSRPKPQFVTLTGVCKHRGCIDATCMRCQHT